MNYEKIYKDLCESRKYRGTKREYGYEVHHILPRCMGGSDSKSNLVKLTFKEHYLAHKLLVKIVEPVYRPHMQSALNLMIKVTKNRSVDDSYKHIEACESIPRTTFIKHLELFEKLKPTLISVSGLYKQENIYEEEIPLLDEIITDINIKSNNSKRQLMKRFLMELKYQLPSGKYYGIFLSSQNRMIRKFIEGLHNKGYLNLILDKKHCPQIIEISKKLLPYVEGVKYSKNKVLGLNFSTYQPIITQARQRLGDSYEDLFFVEVAKYKVKVYPRKLWEYMNYSDSMKNLFCFTQETVSGLDNMRYFSELNKMLKRCL